MNNLALCDAMSRCLYFKNRYVLKLISAQQTLNFKLNFAWCYRIDRSDQIMFYEIDHEVAQTHRLFTFSSL